MKAPSFWSDKGFISTAFMPLSFIYQGLSKWRSLQTQSYHSLKPVICVGNLTSGGTGKTPICAALAQMIQQQGLHPVILTRGYGGNVSGPILVDKNKHKPAQTGDEPRLLAQYAPVVIARNRAKGAKFIENTMRCDVIIMDDGLQNPQLAKDLSIGVFDGRVGVQNGRLFPAGPLRTSLKSGKKMLDLVLINGKDTQNIKQIMSPLPCLGFHLLPQKTQAISPQAVIAFAGIGQPKRFFDLLDQQGFTLTARYEFGDHHAYSEAELKTLKDKAEKSNARLITTEKDWVRLAPSWQKLIDYYPVHLDMTDKDKDTFFKQIIATINS